MTHSPTAPTTTPASPAGRRRALVAMLALACGAAAHGETAQAIGPRTLIATLSSDVLAAVKADTAIQAGDLGGVRRLVDRMVMPHVDLRRMTAAVVGRAWRDALPAQREALQNQFKTLLIRTYGGALTMVRDQTVRLKPQRDVDDADAAIVRTEVRGSGRPFEIDYRLRPSTTGWRIEDLNVLGVWLVPVYRQSFGKAIEAHGIDGLIAALDAKNSAAAPQ